MSKLTIKQKRFADEYLLSGNATESAIKAGYAKKAAYRMGSENLRKPQTSQSIHFEKSDRALTGRFYFLKTLQMNYAGTNEPEWNAVIWHT